MIEILMPYYGDPDLLRVAVESVIGQDDPDWTLVVVDNHYPDPAPGEWVRALDDSRVRYLRNEQNLGVSGNLRRCLEIARSPYFVIMGADDQMHPNYVSSINRAIQEYPEAAMIQPRVRVIDEDGTPITPLGDRIKTRLAPGPGRDHVLGGESLAKSLLRGNWLYFPAIALRRSAVGTRTFRPDLETVLDLDFVMELLMEGGTLVLLDEEAFSYRRHASSVSSLTARDTERFVEEARVHSELAPRLRAIGWNGAARTARLRPTSRLHALALLPAVARSRDKAIARELIRHAAGRH